MKNKIYNIISGIAICGVLLGTSLVQTGCRKEMFMPEPEGTAVPYKDSISNDLQTYLKSSPYKLFYAAWQRSNMQKELEAMGSKASVTLLVVDDAAMKAAGLDETEINKRSPESLLEVVKYHMLRDKMEPMSVQPGQLSYHRTTLLSRTDLVERINRAGSAVSFTVPYTYRHYVAMAKDSQLIIDGKLCGNQKPVVVKNGIVWPVNRFLQKPEQHVLDILQGDPRFSLLVAINQLNNDAWFEVAMGSFERWSGLFLTAGEWDNNVIFNSYFAPTDDAFHQAGIFTVEQLQEINSRFTPEFVFDPFYGMTGLLPTDSVLDYHNWGRLLAPKTSTGESPVFKPTVFYSNDLDETLLSNYTISVSKPDLKPAPMPLAFIREGNTIKVKVRGAKTPAATVTTADINTLEGPLHIVDRLFIPDDFKVK
ncbi:hypothetical protein HGH92_07760 [Chitinophaga varians]|uniref:FAS1 domain-containing protein n=1 Tax=Chitinophaga varians TaxID=2202339 RepID=A0A847RTK6_9BACT|nr:fasciclin domain-containing protein [Chitinophaga varians]NLR64198.1 hypothetical protein [Chitinophaga varians]